MEYLHDNVAQPKVSIIVPVYNVECYLRRCLNSIINQTLREIEIICINDGSTDKSLEILEEYALRDKRITVLSQENSKQGAARNKGLDIAKGEFITFVDADDWINECYVKELYNACIDMDVNMAVANMVRDKKNKTKIHLELLVEEVLRGAGNIIKNIDNHFETAGKLYKRKCISDLRFQEGVLYEDGGYTIRAINMCGACVTVPSAVYHYVSNAQSTIKQKLGIKNQNDKIETSLDLINYAENNNIKMKEWCIYKERHFLWGIKHYYKKKDFYFCGIKVYTKKEDFDNSKVFLVFNTAYFGDVLLCNSLVQNIKDIFPKSKVIFVCDKNWKDVAKYQRGVDDVVVYDKKGAHKGLFGLFKFVREFKYKKPYASIITYKNERNFFVAKLLHSKLIIMSSKSDQNVYKPFSHSQLLQQLTHKKIKNLPIKFDLPIEVKNPLEGEKYVTLCCITKKSIKDMPLDTAIALINEINDKTDYKVVFTGTGEKAMQYATQLEQANIKFINLVNKTSILELGAVIKGCEAVISCDTGTMHYANALNIPTVAVFYENGTVPIWAPKPELYNSVVVENCQTAENIYNAMSKIVETNRLQENKCSIL